MDEWAEVGDLRSGQSQGFDFRKFGVGRNVGDAVAKLCEGVVDGHGAPTLLLVGRVAALHHPHPRTHATNGTCTTSKTNSHL